jgi:hypothetical protein
MTNYTVLVKYFADWIRNLQQINARKTGLW